MDDPKDELDLNVGLVRNDNYIGFYMNLTSFVKFKKQIWPDLAQISGQSGNQTYSSNKNSKEEASLENRLIFLLPGVTVDILKLTF